MSEEILELDHVLIAVADLANAAREIEARHGLASVEGGRHPGWGTANRIVPLGETYLELIAVIAGAEAAWSPFGSWVVRIPPSLNRSAGLFALADSTTSRAGSVWRLVPAQEPRATAKYCGGELSQTRTERPSAITRIKAAIKAANRKLEELGIEPISERVTPHSLRRFGPRLGMTPCTSRSSSATRTRTSR